MDYVAALDAVGTTLLCAFCAFAGFMAGTLYAVEKLRGKK